MRGSVALRGNLENLKLEMTKRAEASLDGHEMRATVLKFWDPIKKHVLGM